jgi:hypothetical protein
VGGDAGRLLRRLAHGGWTVVLPTSAGGAELSALRRAIGAHDAITATASTDDVDEGKPARSTTIRPARWSPCRSVPWRD